MAEHGDPFQEMVLGDPDDLITVIHAAETLLLGWRAEKEAVALADEEGRVSEYAVHFRVFLWPNPKLVPAEEVPR